MSMSDKPFQWEKRGKGNLQDITVHTEAQEFFSKKYSIKIKNEFTGNTKKCDKVAQKCIN